MRGECKLNHCCPKQDRIVLRPVESKGLRVEGSALQIEVSCFHLFVGLQPVQIKPGRE
jgi:hypothetical protein